MKNKRAQAALEFLMTYGWAILVVLVVIGALAYFGVLNPNILVPEKCTLATGLSCDDYTVSEESVRLKLGNGLGRDIEIESINVTGVAGTATGTPNYAVCGNSTIAAADDQIANGGAQEFIMYCNTDFEPSTRKSKASIEVRYHFADSTATFSHTVTGELMAKVQ